MEDVVVGVVDVGSPQKNRVGWAIVTRDQKCKGQNLDRFIDEFAEFARNGRPAVLGFEAPLFVPFGRGVNCVTKQRKGENGRPWSAGAGATVTTVGIAVIPYVVIPYVLSKLRPKLADKEARLDWTKPVSGKEILIFEAFVSGRAKQGSDEDDALAAAYTVWDHYPDLDKLNCIDEPNVFSLIEAYLVRTGWRAASQTKLTEICLVIRPCRK